ncbi:hypothetical protein HOY82DRAFT_180294 [Tuber indicum]|nr:hypothetical protein HOY82DRAFT_180294 [Tuber indicum]
MTHPGAVWTAPGWVGLGRRFLYSSRAGPGPDPECFQYESLSLSLLTSTEGQRIEPLENIVKTVHDSGISGKCFPFVSSCFGFFSWASGSAIIISLHPGACLVERKACHELQGISEPKRPFSRAAWPDCGKATFPNKSPAWPGHLVTSPGNLRALPGHL